MEFNIDLFFFFFFLLNANLMTFIDDLELQKVNDLLGQIPLSVALYPQRSFPFSLETHLI